MAWRDPEFPEHPYPGAVPPGSFGHVDGVTHPVPARELDAWLSARGAPALAARLPVLAYGSNRNPSKITWLRAELGLGADPVVVLPARTTGVAAVWAAGLRARDGQRPAVLAAAPGVVEEHALWMATPEQVEVLDRCEGRGGRHRLARLDTGSVHIGDFRIDRPWVYLGADPTRCPLHVDGAPVRCADVPQEQALALAGEPGADGLTAETVAGRPHPDEWPAALFTYGLLAPGRPAWHLVAPHAGQPRKATVDGLVFDTGKGYPGWLPDRPGIVHGVLIPVRDPAALLPVLDDFEGPEYQRICTTTIREKAVCWAYAWRSSEPARHARPG